MSKPATLKITSTIEPRMKVLKKKVEKIEREGMIAVGLQLINNIVNGSPAEPVVPPILTGLLRGSGSVFFESELVSTLPPVNGQGDPATSYTGESNTVTVGFNTAYAKKLHEKPFNPGPVSQQSGNVGHKFVEKHLKKDGKELFKLYAAISKKRLDEDDL
jgi:hypothetical protein